MKKILKKIWNSPPKSWFKKLKKYFLHFDKKKDSWNVHNVKVLEKDISLLMPNEIPETYMSMLDGSYEIDLISKLAANKNKVVWDIGAHIGYLSLFFSSAFGEETLVYAFEPNPSNQKWLESNININEAYSKRIFINKEAITNKVGEVEFNVGNADDATSSGGYIKDVTPPLQENSYEDFKKIKVESNTIDNLISQKKLSVPDFIKIDVEGAELKVLEGGINTLQQNGPELIIEIHTIPMMFHVSNFLEKLGYKINIWDEDSQNFTKIIHARKQN
ncbi:MAG: FkbM family methyltransferase [Candidatus Paceibacterota bacterium]